MAKQDWAWMPCAGHFILGKYCRYHLCTYVNGYIISTIGQLWPDDNIRRIYAESHNKLNPNNQIDLSLKGDDFDREYFKKKGFHGLGFPEEESVYETMVFKGKKRDEGSQCCPYMVSDWGDLDCNRYSDAAEAYQGHLRFCQEYDLKTMETI